MRSSTISLLATLTIALCGTAVTATIGGCDVATNVANAINIPIEFDHTLPLNLDIGQVTGQLAGQTSPTDQTFPVDTGALPVNLISQSPELAANKDKIRRIEFTSITVAPKSNTMTAATPPLDIYIGAKGATKSSEGIKIATIPSIPAGSTAVVNAIIDGAGQDAAQAHILTMDFTVIPTGTLAVKSGQEVPGGKVDLNLTLAVKAIFNPTK